MTVLGADRVTPEDCVATPNPCGRVHLSDIGDLSNVARVLDEPVEPSERGRSQVVRVSRRNGTGRVTGSTQYAAHELKEAVGLLFVDSKAIFRCVFLG